MHKKIFQNIFFVTIVGIFITTILMLVSIYSMLEKSTFSHMKNEAELIGAGLNYYEDSDYIQSSDFKNTLYRVTIIEPNGEVLFDNRAKNLENHKDRPEFIEALKSGKGDEKRYSSTLGKTTYYYAIKLANGNVLRLANTQNNIWGVFIQIIPALLGILLLTAVVGYFMARQTTKKLMLPVNKIVEQIQDNEKTITCDYDELIPFVSKINSQREKIRETIENLKKDRDTISTITEHMKEGLILLDGDENILSMNSSARNILKVKGNDFVGKKIITATRNEIVNKMAEKAVKGDYSNTILVEGEKYYQMYGCQVENKDENIGTILFFVDITSDELSHKMRKEFTANVSHELKTPLTSISGYAEMMKNGMVAPEHMTEFSDKIYKESQRMIHLVNDILTLSKLDEATEEIPMSKVNLYEAAKQTIEMLGEEAAAKGVSLNLKGNFCELQSSETMIHQLLYNLIQNGIKYNKAQGNVEVEIGKEENQAIIKIQDTGIGIPEGEKERIFERFYRVDKSRSKNIGGTGLGLSIVKHILEILKGQIQLESTLGEGTTIIIKLPD